EGEDEAELEGDGRLEEEFDAREGDGGVRGRGDLERARAGDGGNLGVGAGLPEKPRLGREGAGGGGLVDREGRGEGGGERGGGEEGGGGLEHGSLPEGCGWGAPTIAERAHGRNAKFRPAVVSGGAQVLAGGLRSPEPGIRRGSLKTIAASTPARPP